jgi:(1->4)-alpha-D-glucan 1-alpha-D-glucosylmutase
MVEHRSAILPRATYRLQFHQDFGFADAHAIVPYLAALGISHVYASPITTARPGSTHGYDVIDFNHLNPELGTEADFEALIETLHAHGMGLLLDFVPNHMGIGSDNPWWLDVLEWGQTSAFAEFFDIDWEASARGPQGKVLLPELGDHYGRVLEAGELVLVFDADGGSFHIVYYDNRFPIGVRHYPRQLQLAMERLGGPTTDLTRLVEGFAGLAGGASEAGQATRRREAAALKQELAAVAAADPASRAAIEATVAAINGTPGQPESFRALHRLLDDQVYRLAFWRVASSDINYRRFFDINELAGLRMERAEVFEQTHRMVLRLIAEDKVQGLRLDHIDGLYDPAGYCRRLLERAAAAIADAGRAPVLESHLGAPIYLIVEKILARHETLREDLPVAGTTGYEFMALVGGLFVDPGAERSLTTTYHRFAGREIDYEDAVVAAKTYILRYSLDSELHVLADELYRLAQQSWSTRDYTLSGLREALTEVIVRFPVYRTYITAESVQPDDRRYLDWAIGHARKRSGLVDRSIFDFLHAALSTDLKQSRDYRRHDVIATAMHFQQLTGPVMAKSVEDTAFYRYHRLIALNEVGGEPDQFGTSLVAFHHVIQQRQRRHPHTMLATATHDHKRGEDTRVRIAALSELPGEWRRRVRRWATLNRFKRQEVEDQRVPGRNDEYLLYQTLIGAWPLEIGTPDDTGLGDLAERIVAYMIKASREAKFRTSWTAPDADYEAGLERFVRRVLDPQDSRAFLADLLAFQAGIALIGAVNGLAQTLLKLTVPGVPDIYRGTELWDLSVVDPDNRRRVDFDRRRDCLEQPADPAALLRSWRDGRIKRHVIARTLALRSREPDLFAFGDYLPLGVEGSHAGRVVAFARQREAAAAIVVAPRLVASLLEGAEVPLPARGAWADTGLQLPSALTARPLVDVLTGRELGRPTSERLAVAEVLCDLPVALLSSAP